MPFHAVVVLGLEHDFLFKSASTYCATNVFVKDIGSLVSSVLQNHQNFVELTSNIIYIVVFGGGLKCPRKIHRTGHIMPITLD